VGFDAELIEDIDAYRNDYDWKGNSNTNITRDPLEHRQQQSDETNSANTEDATTDPTILLPARNINFRCKFPA
jgi:hypothetical protein